MRTVNRMSPRNSSTPPSGNGRTTPSVQPSVEQGPDLANPAPAPEASTQEVPQEVPQEVSQEVSQEAPQTLNSPFRPKPLKAAFQGLSVSYGYNPRLPERARIYLLGLRKQFKSSFAASNPDACILDFEGGANAVMAPRAYVCNLSATATAEPGTPAYEAERAWLKMPVLERYAKIKAQLIADASTKDPQFKTIGFDSIDLFIELLITDFCREVGVEHIGDYKSRGAGYNRVLERLMRELQDFEEAGYGLIIVAHLGEKTLNNGDDSQLIIRPRISDSFHKGLLMKVDQILQISLTSISVPAKVAKTFNGKTIMVDDKENRVTKTEVLLRSIPTPENPERGCRVQIPDKLQLPLADAWQTYARAYRAEVRRVRASLGQDPNVAPWAEEEESA